MIKYLNAILVVSLLAACSKQPNIEVEKPNSAEFEIMRLKDPSTGDVPSHLLYKLLPNQMGASHLYKTDRIYPNSWFAIDDQFASLAISKLAYDPNDFNVFYFCTGEGWGNVGAQRGAGVWKSVDAGKTWSQLSSTADTNNFFYCQDMVVHPDNSDVYVATTRGLMRSQDGGASWEHILGVNNGSVRDGCTDIEIAENGDLFASMGFYNSQFGQGADGIYYSKTGDVGSWEKRMNGFQRSSYARIEIASAPSDSNVIYAIPERVPVFGRASIDGIYRSNDQGLNWFALATPNNDLSLANDQAWYDLIITVDPNDEDVAVAGGLHLWKTVNGGQSWFRLTSGNRNGTSFPYVHVDQHEVIFRSSDTVYFTNDGGIYRSTNFTAPTPAFEDIDQNYNTTQFYSAAIHPGAGNQRVIGGTQDNGSNGSTETGVSDFDRISGSDGGFALIDQTDPDYSYTTTQYRRVYRNFQGTRVEITNPNLINDNTIWINPLAMDPNESQRIYQASNVGIWRLDGARSASGFGWVKCTRTFGPISAMDISKSRPNLLVFGRTTNQIPFKVDNAHITDETYTPISMDKNGELPSGAYLNCVYIDPKDEDHIILVYSNYGVESVFETKDGMANDPTWVSAEGNLPNIPIRWAVLHPDNSEVCYLATELGMYYTDKLDGASTIWKKGNNSLANLRMDMIRVRESDNTFVIGSHGRGLYTGKTMDGSNDIEWIERGPSNVGGRTRTLMIDPNVPSGKKLWAGNVSGGLWSINDIDSVNEFVIIPPEDSDYELSIYPNPAWSYIYLEFDPEIEGERSILMYNELGQLVKEDEFNLEENKLSYSVRDLSYGIYFIELKQGDETVVKKIVLSP